MTPPENRDLDWLIAAANAPALAQEQDEQALEVVLAAFNAAGAADARAQTASVARPGRTARQWAGTVARCAAALGIMTGGSVAVASAGILPPPVQTFAHSVFGGIGVPAPATGGGPGSVTALVPTASPSASASASSARPPTATATASARATVVTPTSQDLEALCDQVLSEGSEWRGTMSQSDTTLLAATAGGASKVVTYCTRLLHVSEQDTTTQQPVNGTPPATSHGNGNGSGNGNGAGGNGNSDGTGDRSSTSGDSGSGSGDSGGDGGSGQDSSS